MTLNDDFAFQLKAYEIYHQREYKCIPGRRFAFDFWISNGATGKNLLVELQGGVYQYQVSHTSAGGIRRDCEKSNLAVLNGYVVMHFTTDMVKDGTAINLVMKYLEK